MATATQMGNPCACQNAFIGTDLGLRALGCSALLADQAAEDLPGLDPGRDIDGAAGLPRRFLPQALVRSLVVIASRPPPSRMLHLPCPEQKTPGQWLGQDFRHPHPDQRQAISAIKEGAPQTREPWPPARQPGCRHIRIPKTRPANGLLTSPAPDQPLA